MNTTRTHTSDTTAMTAQRQSGSRGEISDTGDPVVDVRRTGRIFGWLFIGTFVTSIPARLLFIHGLGATWSDVRFLPGDTSSASLKFGAVLEFGLIVTQLGTALVIHSLVKRQSETLSLSYIAARTMESVLSLIHISEPTRPY